MRTHSSAAEVLIGLCTLCCCACGGGGNGNNTRPPPVIGVTVSPATANVEVGKAQQFTATVTGTSSITVDWSVSGVAGGNSTVGSITSTGSYTAPLGVPSPSTVTVAATSRADPKKSATATVTVASCSIAAEGPASEQTHARLGAYYFDGWSGPLTNYHFNGLPFGLYQDRQPLSGWQDNSPCAVEQQLAWARRFGIDFFVFDWYFNAEVNDPGEDLNSALKISHSLPDRHGMQYAILYVDAPPFVVAPADWTTAVGEWTSYFTDPAYVLVNGKPLFLVIDMGNMRQAFGSSVAVADAFAALRTAAQARGFPGVYIVGGIAVANGSAGQDALFPDLTMAQADGYDALSAYNYPYAPPAFDGMLPFSTLSGAGKWIWNQVALKSPVPFISIAMDGWDPRPWDEREGLTQFMMYYSRSPNEVATFVSDAITWAESNPKLRPEASPAPPIVLVEAWNELGEGSYMVPTVGDGTSYGDALATMLAFAPARTRSVLALDETGPADPNRSASGTLTDADGAPIAGAPVALDATAVDGPGFYAEYPLSGQVPASATQAVVGFRVNIEGGGPGASEFSLYQVSYVQNADGIERVANGDFSLGAQSWVLGGPTQLVASDRGAGQMVQVQVSSSQAASLTSAPFDVASGATFQVAFSSRVAPLSVGSGYFTVIFLNSGIEFQRYTIPLAPGKLALGTTGTDGAGTFQMSLTSLGGWHVILEANYAGDAQHWPGYARVTR